MRASWVDEGAPFPCQSSQGGGGHLLGETSHAHCVVVSVDRLVLA